MTSFLTEGIFLYLWYNLFLFLMDDRNASDNQGFLLEYFFFILIFGNYLL